MDPKRRQEYLVAGLTAEQLDDLERESARVDAALNNLRCPKCDKTISRALDPRQDGPTFGAGSWVNYRCTHCKYMCDRAELPN